MNIAHFLIKDIFQKKIRVLFTILGVGIGVCVCIIMLGIGESIKNSFKDTYTKRQIDIILQEKEQLSILLSRVEADIVKQIQSMPQVENAAATLLYIHRLKSSAVPVFGWEPGSFLFDNVEIRQGRSPQAGKKEVMVGVALMRSLKKDNTKQIKIKGAVFSISGVFKSSSPFEQFAVVMPLGDLQEMLGQKGKATFINVRLKESLRKDPAIENSLKEIEDAFPSVSAMRLDTFIAEKTKFIVIGEQFSFLVSLITIIAVALGLANTMVTSAFEKRKFLSILLALGWQKKEIAVLFVCEALIVASLGGLIGMLLGFKGTAYIFDMTSIQAFAPSLSLGFVLKIIALILGSAVIAAIAPIWVTLNSNPVEIIRSE